MTADTASGGAPPSWLSRVSSEGARLRRRYGFGIVAITPALVLLLAFMVYPAIQALIMSTADWRGMGPVTKFVGLSNFQRLWESGQLVHAVITNLLYAALLVPLTVAIGFLLAAAIHRRVRGWRAFKIVWFLPVVLPSIVVAFLWSGMIYAPGGGLDSLFGMLGLPLPKNGWLATPETALIAVVITAVWQSVGWPMIVFLAGMSRIPEEIYEAAAIDGATERQLLIHITLPLMKPVFAAVVTLQLIFSLKAFDTIFVMTRGGPGHLTQVMALLMYDWSFTSLRFGMGAAVAVVMLVLVTSLSLVQRRFAGIDAAAD
jgi:raffinose/stachyose/melibiose transport system permease protein